MKWQLFVYVVCCIDKKLKAKRPILARMSEVIITFQSQLSGVMETVFKAAMFEITRLVEDSFLEEVSRSREQVESLKKRLQLFENRRKDRDNPRRTRCVNCGKADGTSENPVDRSGETQSSK